LGGLFPGGSTWPADGGIGQITVSAPSNCGWSVDWNAPWITPLQTSGTGNATLSYAIDRNDSGVSRSGAITVGGATFNITQTEVFTGVTSGGSGGGGTGGCAYTLSPVYILVGSGGAAIPLHVTTPDGCSGSLSSTDSWISFSQTQGSGTWTATVTVAANVGAGLRTGTIRIGNQAITVDENAPADDARFSQFNLPTGVDYSHATFEWRRDEATATVQGETCYFLDGWRCYNYDPDPVPGPPNPGCTYNCIPEDPSQGGGGAPPPALPEFCEEGPGPKAATAGLNLLNINVVVNASPNISAITTAAQAAAGQWNGYTSTTRVQTNISQVQGVIDMRRKIDAFDTNMTDPCADFDPDTMSLRWTLEFENLMSSSTLGAKAITLLAHELGHAVFSLKDREPYSQPRSIMEQYPLLPVPGGGSCTERLLNFAPVPVQPYDASNARQCVAVLRSR
jgi:hypothetical protein